MLETNNPYMFGSSTTTTTTTTTAPNPSSPVPPQTSSSTSSTSVVGAAGSTSTHPMQQQPPSRPMHHHHHSNSYYMGKGGDDEYYHNHQHASRISPAYMRHPEEPSQQQSSQQQQPVHYTSTYKPAKSIYQNNTIVHPQHNEPDKLNTYMRPSVHVYPHQQPQHIKSEASPHMLPAPPPPPPSSSSFMKSRKAVDEPDWYERENKSHRPPTSGSTAPAIIPFSNANTTMTTTTLSHTAPLGGETSTLEAGDNKKIKRRKEMTSIMEDLNKDFLKKRERLYTEKLHAINQELKSAHQDTHPSYLDGVKDLEAMRRKTIRDGVLFREYQNEVTDNQFQLEIYQAEEEYTAEIQDIREKLFASLDEKRRKLKEEKDNCDLAYDVILESQSRLHKRNLRKREKEHPESKSSKKKQLTGPALVFKLKDDDILSDIQAMRNGLSSCNSASGTTTTTAAATTTNATASAAHKKTNSSNKKK
ncbi:hypothetical protein MUCCIDRAFT_186003 [Mucor lusitanicus CBS 277.49]|uniref:Uncharacterized protein n=1 Tax=Mucor lusitanicus CBS 277.49 TaxID=747725 RepID=A0A168GFU6_MUCCL|nr:hypothetical protein MUCCIDRAFT_186003 [Mucor lusitanicus CBS 277.49]